MPNRLSRTQIDKLGDRLRAEEILSSDDLRLLDEYRRTFAPAYELVVATLRDVLHLEPTGRPAKTTYAIGEKLRRESIRLTQIQDIAGCRIVVQDLAEQNSAVQRIVEAFPGARVIDRRESPSYGYRAVHVVVTSQNRPVEIQVRTTLQHKWAEVSEKLADREPGIKYGSGPAEILQALALLSKASYEHELLFRDNQELAAEVSDNQLRARIDRLRQKLDTSRQKLHDLLELLAP